MLPINAVEQFRDKYFSNKSLNKTVLDVGSMDPASICKSYFPYPYWVYIGLDIRNGPNVDLCVSNPYSWAEIFDSSYDAVISVHTFEHVEYPWLTICEIHRVMKQNAKCCIIVPAIGTRHRFPRDCWRIRTDGMKALAKWANIKILELTVLDDKWRSSALIGEKN